jgi:hypothetical protein
MQDAIAVSLEARAHGVGSLFDAAIAGAARQGGALCERGPLERFAVDSRKRRAGGEVGRAVVVREAKDAGALALHRGRPPLGAFRSHHRNPTDDH